MFWITNIWLDRKLSVSVSVSVPVSVSVLVQTQTKFRYFGLITKFDTGYVVLSKTVLSKIRRDPPTGGVRWWKNKLKGLLKHARLGQVRQPIKSSIIGPHSFLSPFFNFRKIIGRKGGIPEGLVDERTDWGA